MVIKPMEKMEIFSTPKRRRVMLHLLHAHEKDIEELPDSICGWRSIEWATPRFDEKYYISDKETRLRSKKKVMEFFRVLKEKEFIEKSSRSRIENLIRKNVEKESLYKIKQKMGLLKNINTMWRINPSIVHDTRDYFNREDLVRTAVDLKETNMVIERLKDHLDTLYDLKKIFNSRLMEGRRERVRGDPKDMVNEIEFIETKIIWIKNDLDYLGALTED